jgi:nucleotide-binding universal stress UspA family protein
MAELMGRQSGGTLLLVRIIPLVSSSTLLASEGGITSPEVYQQLSDDEQLAAQDYLDKQADTLRAHGIDIRTVVSRGEPARCLLDLMDSEHVDLIVMTTHGRSGLARWALGSVADGLVHICATPLLLVRSAPAAG